MSQDQRQSNTLQEGDTCNRKTCGGVFIEKDEGKFVCDECGNIVGNRSIDVS